MCRSTTPSSDTKTVVVAFFICSRNSDSLFYTIQSVLNVQGFPAFFCKRLSLIMELALALAPNDEGCRCANIYLVVCIIARFVCQSMTHF